MKNGAPISGQKPLAICYAAQKGYLDVIKYLYENGKESKPERLKHILI